MTKNDDEHEAEGRCRISGRLLSFLINRDAEEKREKSRSSLVVIAEVTKHPREKSRRCT
jgi:hypothetical protein